MVAEVCQGQKLGMSCSVGLASNQRASNRTRKRVSSPEVIAFLFMSASLWCAASECCSLGDSDNDSVITDEIDKTDKECWLYFGLERTDFAIVLHLLKLSSPPLRVKPPFI